MISATAARQKIERGEAGRRAPDHRESTVTALVKLDAFRALGSRRQGHDRRRGRVIGPVMFAQTEHVETDLVGQFDSSISAQPFMRADGAGAGLG